MKRKEIDPQGFPLSLALVDAVPVVLFSVSCLSISRLFSSRLFLWGAALSALAGWGKVLWKLLVAAFSRNIPILNRQMKVLMPLGFLMMLCSLIVDRSMVSLGGILRAVTAFPALVFFLLFLVGMTVMGVFAKTLDSNDVHSNWVEQLTTAQPWKKRELALC